MPNARNSASAKWTTRLYIDLLPRGILAESATIQAMRLTALAFALLPVAACGGARPAPQPPAVASSVLIVTIDTLRADRVGIYGGKVETPNIDRLAREGAWAPQADVQVPMTRPSHVSLFTGRYPAEHGIRDNISQPLAADVPVLAQAFHEA